METAALRQPTEMGFEQIQGGGKESTVWSSLVVLLLGATSTNGHTKAAAGMVQVLS